MDTSESTNQFEDDNDDPESTNPFKDVDDDPESKNSKMSMMILLQDFAIVLF
jgi:hypothetical protein